MSDYVYFESNIQAKLFIEVEKINLKVLKYQRVIFQNPTFMKSPDIP